MEFRRAYDPIRALSGAWALVARRPLTLLVGAFLMFAAESAKRYGVQWQMDGSRDIDGVAALLLSLLVSVVCLLGIVNLVLFSLFRCGLATAVERVAVTGEEEIRDLFRSRGRLLSMVLTRILVAILWGLALVPFALLAAMAAVVGSLMGGDEAAAALAILTLLVCVPGWIYIVLGFALAPMAVAFEGHGPIEAVRRSWGLVRGNRLWLFWFLLVTIVFELLGCCFFCIGAVATSMWVYLAQHEAYLRLIRPDQADWVVDGGAGAEPWCAVERVTPRSPVS